MSNRNHVERVESCSFSCEAGPLVNNTDWQHIKAELAELRAQKPVGETCFDAQGIRWYNTSDRERLPFGTKLYAAPVPAQPAAKTVCDALEITNAIILDVCETDPADPSHPETVCINVDDLRETVERHILTAKGDGT